MVAVGRSRFEVSCYSGMNFLRLALRVSIEIASQFVSEFKNHSGFYFSYCHSSVLREYELGSKRVINY